MAGPAKEFEPFADEKTVYLQQIDGAAAEEVEEILAIPVPFDEIDILVGLLDAPPVENGALMAAWILAIVLGILVVLVGGVILKILTGQIDLSLIISESNGKASLSRLQALIFSVVVASSLLVSVSITGTLPDSIPYGVLAIMGGSLGTYLASKGIQTFGGPDGFAPGQEQGTAAQMQGPLLRYGQDDSVAVGVTDLAPNRDALHLKLHLTPEDVREPKLVAVAVGATRLSVSLTYRPEDIEVATLRYADESGAVLNKDLMSATEITTPAGKLTEVHVVFKLKHSRASEVGIVVNERSV